MRKNQSKTTMRYLVRYFDGVDIINDLRTDDFSKVLIREKELKKLYKEEDVWYADMVLEWLVG
jgi:hypothetical protein